MSRKSLLSVPAVCGAVLASLLVLGHGHSAALASTSDEAAKQPVVVELFTSEGCSSCPPADTLLKSLSEEQPLNGIEILALEEHVDYWNSAQWVDPFSSIDFSLRQQQYAAALRAGDVFTPQMIVDGSAQLVGSRTREAKEQIRWAAARQKGRLLLTSVPASKEHTRSFELRLDPSSAALNSSPLELWIAVTEKGLHSSVTGGENSGETLQHAPVVRLLHKQQSITLPLTNPINVSVNLHKSWNAANLTVVAFLADPKSHQIQAAGYSPIS
jgi:hypothetical protein